jgi:hypothetical protein
MHVSLFRELLMSFAWPGARTCFFFMPRMDRSCTKSGMRMGEPRAPWHGLLTLGLWPLQETTRLCASGAQSRKNQRDNVQRSAIRAPDARRMYRRNANKHRRSHAHNGTP